MQALVELPGWLVLGTGLGLVLTVVVAAAFVVGGRAFPGGATPASGGSASGDTRRRAEIRRYLLDIGETFTEDHPHEGYSVEFYLPARDVAITFDPRTFYGLTNTPTEAVLVEHEMPGRYLGSRLPFETPAVDPGDNRATGRTRRPGEWGRGVDEAEAAFAALGLPANASEAEVRSAYRERAKAVHPDNGGDPEAFKELADAYATARERATS